VPAGIGIDPGGRFISPLHTHDTSGVVHVESPTIRPFTLGELFGVWGVPLGSASRAFVDGRPLGGDPRRLILKPHQEIVVAFGRLPRRVPAHYEFAPGL
jgi:hypothetical protein